MKTPKKKKSARIRSVSRSRISTIWISIQNLSAVSISRWSLKAWNSWRTNCLDFSRQLEKFYLICSTETTSNSKLSPRSTSWVGALIRKSRLNFFSKSKYLFYLFVPPSESIRLASSLIIKAAWIHFLVIIWTALLKEGGSDKNYRNFRRLSRKIWKA